MLAVLAIALLARLTVIAASDDYRPVDDAADYDRLATSLADTGRYPPTQYARHGSPSALRPPAYPYTLALTYELTGRSWTAGRVLGAVLGGVSVALIALVALR